MVKIELGINYVVEDGNNTVDIFGLYDILSTFWWFKYTSKALIYYLQYTKFNIINVHQLSHLIFEYRHYYALNTTESFYHGYHSIANTPTIILILLKHTLMLK